MSASRDEEHGSGDSERSQQAVEPVQEAALPGERCRVVLDAGAPLRPGRGPVPAESRQCDAGRRDWLTYGILHEALASSAAIRICRNELWAASSMTAWHRSVPSLFEIPPVDTPELQRQALQRLAALPKFIDVEIANLRRGLAGASGSAAISSSTTSIRSPSIPGVSRRSATSTQTRRRRAR